jgi:alpha-tubulin suppressor-like RCC1 family protein
MIDRVETGTGHTCFLQGGKAYCVGRNDHGQAGPGSDPKRAPGESILGDVRDIAAATTHTCAVTTDGKVHCWGSNASKQLGVEGVDRSEKAVPVPLPSN